jgi:NADPH2:quinone reductase
MSQDYRAFIRANGGPDVIEFEPIDLGEPGPGEARVRHSAIGLNFIDTYHRSGLYPVKLPSGLGQEATGLVEAVADDVTEVRPGDRVAYIGGSPGTYATVRCFPAARLVPLPDGIPDEVAAAVMLKGLTAWMLAEPCAKMTRGQTALVHAAAGGVGSLLVQWLKAIGVVVIAHAGSAAKLDRVGRLGADHTLDTPFDELADVVRKLTGGRGVDAVFDGVGAASWNASLHSTAARGLIASYGNASGPVPPISLLEIGQAGSLFVTRPGIFHYVADPAELGRAARTLFAMIGDGKLTVDIGQRYKLRQAAEAHRALEARETMGSTLLIP